MQDDDKLTRKEIISHCLEMNKSGLNQGTSGNISLRTKDGILITPSSTPYDSMQTEDLVLMDHQGRYSNERKKPSSEWRLHTAIYNSKKEVNSIVHTHSVYATALSLLSKDIPACHYMIAIFGGSSVRCADYDIYGSEALSNNVVKALEGRSACLMATHGMVTCGHSLENAMWKAVELETLAKQYYLALQLGRPTILSDDHIEKVIQQMKTGYGVWS